MSVVFFVVNANQFERGVYVDIGMFFRLHLFYKRWSVGLLLFVLILYVSRVCRVCFTEIYSQFVCARYVYLVAEAGFVEDHLMYDTYCHPSCCCVNCVKYACSRTYM